MLGAAGEQIVFCHFFRPKKGKGFGKVSDRCSRLKVPQDFRDLKKGEWGGFGEVLRVRFRLGV